MRALVQPSVLRSASLAMVCTAAACGPRLLSWPDRSHRLWLIWLTLAWAAFFLWSFVFAWHERYLGGSVLGLGRKPTLWITTTLSGIAGGFFLLRWIDPTLRAAAPGDYPDSLASWGAMTLFVLAFDQLFLCFAPVAFFARLFHSVRISAGLTVLFGIGLVYLKLKRSGAQFPPWFVAELIAWRVLAGGLSVFFYLRGGVWLNGGWILVLQLRHLINLL